MKGKGLSDRIDWYADFTFDIGAIVKAGYDSTSIEVRALYFDKVVERYKRLVNEAIVFFGVDV